MKTLWKFIKGLFKSIKIRNPFKVIFNILKKRPIATCLAVGAAVPIWMYNIMPIIAGLIAILPELFIHSNIKGINFMLSISAMFIIFILSSFSPYVLFAFTIFGSIVLFNDVIDYEAMLSETK